MFSRIIVRVSHCHRNSKSCGLHSLANISAANANEALGKPTKVQGWVKAVRKMKNNLFIDINDGSSPEHLQVIVNKDKKPDNLGYGSCISVIGELVNGPNGKTEVQAQEIQVLGPCELDNGAYPFLPRKQYSQEYIRQYLHLRPRTRQFSSILRLRDLASSAIGEHMRQRGFINIHTPVLTSNDCEGAGEVFMVKPESKNLLQEMKKHEDQALESVYFDTKTYLTVSGQLHLETMARALSRVYSFGPIFRAENSKSRMHLSEFYMLEAEIAFISDIKELTNEAELMMKAITSTLFEKGAADINAIGGKEPDWINQSFGCLTYDEAFDVLERHSDQLNVPVKRGEAFAKDHELFLVKYNNDIPLFVIDWPNDMKPFYMKECDNDSSKVAAMDLLAPQIGELFGGSVREDNYEKLQRKVPSSVDLSWYLELRKCGNVSTGGFGMGFERYLQAVLNISNIKDVIPFPRWPHNCSL